MAEIARDRGFTRVHLVLPIANRAAVDAGDVELRVDQYPRGARLGIVKERRPVAFTKDEQFLYDRTFRALSPPAVQTSFGDR